MTMEGMGLPRRVDTKSPGDPQSTPSHAFPPSHAPPAPENAEGTMRERKHVLRFEAPWPIHGLDWSQRPGERGGWRLAIGSLIEEHVNKIQIVTLPEFTASRDDAHVDLAVLSEVDHGYPVTKIAWEPWKGGGSSTDLLATTAEVVRIWELPISGDGELTLRTSLCNTKSEFSAPLTSIDWCDVDPSLLITSSIDTTCTLWNVETGQSTTQLVAHDKEVYDVGFMPGSRDVFASVGADGTARLFDLRALERSTIVYSSPFAPANASALPVIPGVSLLRLQFNRVEANMLATLHVATNIVHVLDVRRPGQPLIELRGHSSPVNTIGWAPHLRNLLVSGGDDSQVLVWDLEDNQHSNHPSENVMLGAPPPTAHKVISHPILAYTAEAEVDQLCWSKVLADRMCISFGRHLQVLKI
ncbi:uncharacterized protein VTP21DRAFT_1565 [Calcarisporiella thermophila]|uniref:uncharacterized protein n=1 Tax=Calcarisporiella thermophila TaxID=911321 RepID=UPI003744A879